MFFDLNPSSSHFVSFAPLLLPSSRVEPTSSTFIFTDELVGTYLIVCRAQKMFYFMIFVWILVLQDKELNWGQLCFWLSSNRKNISYSIGRRIQPINSHVRTRLNLRRGNVWMWMTPGRLLLLTLVCSLFATIYYVVVVYT